MPPVSSYRNAQLLARRLMLSLDRAAAEKIARALEAYADALEGQWARALAQLPAAERARSTRSTAILRELATDLRREIEQAAIQGQRVGVERTLALWEKAGRQALGTGDLAAQFGGVATGNLTRQQAFAALDAVPTLRTLIADRIDLARQEVERIIGQAFAQDVGPRELAARLRPYVTGSEPLRDRIVVDAAGEKIVDLRAIPRELKGAARQVRYNSERIAFSEIHNARAAAELAHFQRDPLIEAIQWELAPDRGTQTEPDVCDLLATVDWYGLGPGVFPIGKVPLSPHPFDRCERFPVVRPVARGQQPKPNPPLRVEPERVPLPPGARTLAAATRLRTDIIRAIREV